METDLAQKVYVCKMDSIVCSQAYCEKQQQYMQQLCDPALCRIWLMTLPVYMGEEVKDARPMSKWNPMLRADGCQMSRGPTTELMSLSEHLHQGSDHRLVYPMIPPAQAASSVTSWGRSRWEARSRWEDQTAHVRTSVKCRSTAQA